ncbi:MAG TPA: pilus assembly protein TadG-related protein [Gaiellaceae bacterium]
MNARKGQSGQATVLSLVFLTVLLGMAALVLDVGSWYRADRDTQSTADAAALAGAQALPADTSQAATLASSYADKNGGGLNSVSFSSQYGPNDTISVRVSRPATGFFSRVFGINSVTVGSKASARTALISQAQYVAPIVVRNTHPELLGTAGCPCFGPGDVTTIPLGKNGAPGAFDLLNLDGSRGGTSPDILASWMLSGYNGYLSLGHYYSDAGAKFNSSQMQNALSQRIGSVLLFPVYDNLTGTGSNAQYHVIGWVGFHLLGFDARGSSGSITGYFTNVIWSGLQASSGSSQPPDFGARSVQLVD